MKPRDYPVLSQPRRADEHAGDRARHSPGRPFAGGDPRSADAPLARTRWLRPARACLRGNGGFDDVVRAGPEPQSRDVASDTQYCRLCWRNQRRSPDADSGSRRDHADPADRGVGLAHADHRNFDREAVRLGCWILGTVLAAGFASCWPRGGAWPLPTGLGGVIGDALVRAPAVIFGPPGFLYKLTLGIIFGAATAASFFVAA